MLEVWLMFMGHICTLSFETCWFTFISPFIDCFAFYFKNVFIFLFEFFIYSGY